MLSSKKNGHQVSQKALCKEEPIDLKARELSQPKLRYQAHYQEYSSHK